MILEKLALFTCAVSVAISAIAGSEAEDEAFNVNYQELDAVTHSMLEAELDEQVEWLLLANVSAAAPPDLRYRVEAIKKSIFQGLRIELCSSAVSASLSLPDRRAAASRNLVAAVSPNSISAYDKGAIAATLVRMIEFQPDRYCLRG